jgi:hypothetical protein
VALGLVCRRYKEFIQKSRNAMMMHLNTRSRTFLVDRALCKISRMRVISSPQARAAAEEERSRIFDAYFEPSHRIRYCSRYFDAPRRIS